MLNTRMLNTNRILSHDHEPHFDVGFRRVTARQPCPVCGRRKWCQVTRDGRLAHCMRESRGSVKRAKDGGYIHVLVYDTRLESTGNYRPLSLNNHKLGSDLAPLEIRDSAYTMLLEISPAWKY